MLRPCRSDWRTLRVDGFRRRRPLARGHKGGPQGYAPKGASPQGEQPHACRPIPEGGQHDKSVVSICGSFV